MSSLDELAQSVTAPENVLVRKSKSMPSCSQMNFQKKVYWGRIVSCRTADSSNLTPSIDECHESELCKSILDAYENGNSNHTSQSPACVTHAQSRVVVRHRSVRKLSQTEGNIKTDGGRNKYEHHLESLRVKAQVIFLVFSEFSSVSINTPK